MAYEADIIRQPGSMIDGDMRMQAKVVVVRYESPTGKPIKVATSIVKAWSANGLRRAGKCEADNIMRRDKEKRRDQIERAIERIERANEVSGPGHDHQHGGVYRQHGDR